MTDISVVIPLGPNPAYLEWLPECIDSVLAQTHLPTEVVLVDDGARIERNIKTFFSPDIFEIIGTEESAWWDRLLDDDKILLRYYRTPWNVGVADAFNFGVGLSYNELVFMLGSDDKLMPTCLEEVVKEYDKQGQWDGWYNVTLVTQSGEESWLPNNAAAVTRGLWKWLGGYPPSAGLAACDAVALSILMVHAPDRIIQVKQNTPLYWAREHEHQDTRKNMSYFAASGVVEAVRNMETQRFVPKGTLK